MSFSYLIKTINDNKYIVLDNNLQWHTTLDRKLAFYMTKDYANILLIEVKKHLPEAIIIGVEYAQN